MRHEQVLSLHVWWALKQDENDLAMFFKLLIRTQKHFSQTQVKLIIEQFTRYLTDPKLTIIPLIWTRPS